MSAGVDEVLSALLSLPYDVTAPQTDTLSFSLHCSGCAPNTLIALLLVLISKAKSATGRRLD